MHNLGGTAGLAEEDSNSSRAKDLLSKSKSKPLALMLRAWYWTKGGENKTRNKGQEAQSMVGSLPQIVGECTEGKED